MMVDELGKIQVLLEDIKSDVKAIAEGHSNLDRKIDAFRAEVNQKFNFLSFAIKDISKDLKEHIRQTAPPAHVAV